MKSLSSVYTKQLSKTHAPAADTATVVTLPATAGEIWVVDTIHYSFDATPDANVKLTITTGAAGSLGFRLDIKTADNDPIVFPRGWTNGVVNEKVEISLDANAAGQSGKLTVTYR